MTNKRGFTTCWSCVMSWVPNGVTWSNPSFLQKNYILNLWLCFFSSPLQNLAILYSFWITAFFMWEVNEKMHWFHIFNLRFFKTAIFGKKNVFPEPINSETWNFVYWEPNSCITHTKNILGIVEPTKKLGGGSILPILIPPPEHIFYTVMWIISISIQYFLFLIVYLENRWKLWNNDTKYPKKYLQFHFQFLRNNNFATRIHGNKNDYRLHALFL